MSVESRLRQASSELEEAATHTAIPEFSTGTKPRPLAGVLVSVAVLAAIAFPLLLIDLRAPSGFVTPEVPLPVSSAAEATIAETILDDINEIREDNDIPPLVANLDLQEYAQLHSLAMANDTLTHSDISALMGPFTVVGENIGYGPTWPSILEAQVASSGHYNNMIDTRFTDAGVGAYLDPAGKLWVTVVFGTPTLSEPLPEDG